MASDLNYRHLHYFWVVAREGGMARAAERLGVAVQTVSAQVHELERHLGYALLRPEGRGLALTEAGRAALGQADRIFELGGALGDIVRDAASGPVARLTVGTSDGIPKLVVSRLLQPIVDQPNLRLVCQEGEFQSLLANVALHRLDVVLADRAAPTSANLKLYSHSLGTSSIAWYAAPALHARARRGFPRSLADLPMLLPGAHAALRASIDAWLERAGIKPRIVGEFADSALLKTFGGSGLGVFPAVELVHDYLVAGYGVKRVGPCGGVAEQFFAIAADKKVAHPLVAKLLARR